jgi:hypothetical protein
MSTKNFTQNMEIIKDSLEDKEDKENTKKLEQIVHSFQMILMLNYFSQCRKAMGTIQI